MAAETMTIAMISDVFVGNGAEDRLLARLTEARSLGAELAVLPELPCNPWSPATKTRRDEDAEPPGGPRQRMQAAAARSTGVALIGGAIIRDPVSGVRRNTAVVLDGSGRQLGTYSKIHLPEEEGFWETSHYEPGREPPSPVAGLPMRIGVQICSDINRPEGCHLLGAMGAEVIIAPRATEQRTYERWKIVFRANAMTSGAYVVSVNRPGPEQGVLMGPPSGSIAVAPDGSVICESCEPVTVVTLHREAVRAAAKAYPGYLDIPASLYAEAWREVAARRNKA